MNGLYMFNINMAYNVVCTMWHEHPFYTCSFMPFKLEVTIYDLYGSNKPELQ